MVFIAIFLVLSLGIAIYIRSRGHSIGTLKTQWRALILVGPGGHAREMREILNGLNKVKYELVFIQGSDKDVATDKLLDEVSHMDKEYSDATEAHKLPVPKSKREHCITAIIKVIYALLRSVWLLIQIEPDLVITNGPGIAVPLCYAAAGMNAILATNIKLIYIESICRVEDLSFTGKLVHPVVHTLVVMWPQVARKWPRTKYFGTLERF